MKVYEEYGEDELVDVDADCVVRTVGGSKVIDFGENHVLLPTSQIQITDEDSGPIVVSMPEWLAKKEGLI